MMLIPEMLFALLLAVIVTAVLVSLRPRDGAPAAALFFFFLIMVFPLIWAGGTWITPVGPVLGGVAWLGFVLVSLFLLLLILAAVPPQQTRHLRKDVMPENAGRETLAGTALFFGLFFWLLLIAAATALVARYTLI